MKFKIQKKALPSYIKPYPLLKKKKRKQVPLNMGNLTLDKRLEASTSTGGKFWAVKVFDNGAQHINGYRFNVEVNYGKLYTRGAVTRKNFSSSRACDAFVQKKLNEKLNKGYVEVGANSVNTTVVAPPPSPATMRSLKGHVSTTATNLMGYVPAGVGAEIIVTMIVGGEVFQETVKR
jgi:predicted DNA-binding WGR domain protein